MSEKLKSENYFGKLREEARVEKGVVDTWGVANAGLIALGGPKVISSVPNLLGVDIFIDSAKLSFNAVKGGVSLLRGGEKALNIASDIAKESRVANPLERVISSDKIVLEARKSFNDALREANKENKLIGIVPAPVRTLR